MVSSATSSGVKLVRTTSLEERFTQYLQSKIHSLVYKIFNKEIHLPSAEKQWQIPLETVLPIPSAFPFRFTPLDVHATSYLAASERISNLSVKLKSF